MKKQTYTLSTPCWHSVYQVQLSSDVVHAPGIFAPRQFDPIFIFANVGEIVFERFSGDVVEMHLAVRVVKVLMRHLVHNQLVIDQKQVLGEAQHRFEAQLETGFVLFFAYILLKVRDESCGCC